MSGSLVEALGLVLIVLVSIASILGIVHLICTVADSKQMIKSLKNDRYQIAADLQRLNDRLKVIEFKKGDS